MFQISDQAGDTRPRCEQSRKFCNVLAPSPYTGVTDDWMTTPPRIDLPTDDALLVQRVQSGDLKSFESLLERHLEAIHAFVSLKLPVPHLVDEITHETFVFAF